jgi:hypothetical protein
MRSISRRRPESQPTQEVAMLATLSVKDLKDRCPSLYDTEPPRYMSRELLTLRWGTVCRNGCSAVSNPPRSGCWTDLETALQPTVSFTLPR